MTATAKRACLHCGGDLPLHNHGTVHHRCAAAWKAEQMVQGDTDAVLARKVREETDLMPWERHPVPWDNVRIVGGRA